MFSSFLLCTYNSFLAVVQNFSPPISIRNQTLLETAVLILKRMWFWKPLYGVLELGWENESIADYG